MFVCPRTSSRSPVMKATLSLRDRTLVAPRGGLRLGGVLAAGLVGEERGLAGRRLVGLAAAGSGLIIGLVTPVTMVACGRGVTVGHGH